jgi:hypothetical protein
MGRIRLRYKMMSGYRAMILKEMQGGRIKISSVLVMADDLFSKKPSQLKQSMKYGKPMINEEEIGNFSVMMEKGLEDIFNQMEMFALGQHDDKLAWPTGENGTMDVLEDELGTFMQRADSAGFEMRFDLNTTEIVDRAVEAMGLWLNEETGRYEGIDLGQDVVPDDDLM